MSRDPAGGTADALSYVRGRSGGSPGRTRWKAALGTTGGERRDAAAIHRGPGPWTAELRADDLRSRGADSSAASFQSGYRRRARSTARLVVPRRHEYRQRHLHGALRPWFGGMANWACEGRNDRPNWARPTMKAPILSRS